MISLAKLPWTPEAAMALRNLVRERTTQVALVEATGIPIATVQRILAGTTNPGEDRLDAILVAIGAARSDVLGGEVRSPPQPTVPIYDITVAAGAGRYSLDRAEPIDQWPFTEAFLAQFGTAADLKLVTVAGDSQEPELGDGDLVMIDTNATRLRDGMHVVRLDDALMIKRVQVQGATVLLKSANPAYDDVPVDLGASGGQFEVIGRAVWASKLL